MEDNMPAYKAYPTVADTPNRKARKARRKTTFEYNAAQAAVERRARRDARKEKANANN
jgi:hypothetical protein